MITLLKAATANDVSPPVAFPGGSVSVMVSGTLTSGLVRFQALSPEGTWVNIDGGDITALSVVNITLSPGTIRAALINAAGLVSVYLLANP
jgi:hypothetical protein